MPAGQIAVVGAGLMGAGIAQVAAQAGYDVLLCDTTATQLDAAMGLYDAFYRWCRDASGETHNWPSQKPGA